MMKCPIDGHHEVATYDGPAVEASRLRVDHKWDMQRLGSPLLGVLILTIVTSGRGYVGMTDETLHYSDVDPAVEEIRDTRPAQIVR